MSLITMISWWYLAKHIQFWNKLCHCTITEIRPNKKLFTIRCRNIDNWSMFISQCVYVSDKVTVMFMMKNCSVNLTKRRVCWPLWDFVWIPPFSLISRISEDTWNSTINVPDFRYKKYKKIPKRRYTCDRDEQAIRVTEKQNIEIIANRL